MLFYQYRKLISRGVDILLHVLGLGFQLVYPDSSIHLFIFSLAPYNISSSGLIPILLSLYAGAELTNNVIGPRSFVV
jgi:hypothetical protein